MKKNYLHYVLKFFPLDCFLSKKPSAILKTVALAIIICFLQVLPGDTMAQNVYSYTYQNVTRNDGGGTLEQGDTIEVRALVRVVSTTTRFFYTATIGAGTQYIPGSLKMITNEGIVINSYTDADGDDDGIYISTGTPRLRVNLGRSSTTSNATAANYSNHSPGGDVYPGDIPKFYGNTLFLVAYRLVITANYGDIISLSGNYFNDTKDTTLNYPAIKIIENQGLCNNFSSATFTAESDFGSGSVQNRVLGATVPGYNKVLLNASDPGDGNYAIANNTSANGTTNDSGPYSSNPARVFSVWDIIGDHTGAADPLAGNPPTPKSPATNGGYMLVVNAAFPTGEVYRDTIKDVCPNTYYEFSAWVRNICSRCGIDQNSISTNLPGVQPNLAFTINDVDYYTTGNIPYSPRGWVKRGFIYKTGPTETSFRITIKNNAPGGGGNDWVLDDIKLATCYPNLIMNPNDTATACAGSAITISDTVKSYFNNYGNYQWEKSLDGEVWTALGPGGYKTPVLENGLYTYHVDYVLTPTAADSGTYFRLKVATTSFNLGDVNCSVDKSQKVFLKVYNASCGTLETNSLNFSGSIGDNKFNLYWTIGSNDNVKGFDIEKSIDGVHYSRVGNVDNNEASYNGGYSFTDADNTSNFNYYRLKLLSSNNTTATYSKTIMLYNRNSLFKVSTVNPFSNNLKINVFLTEKGIVQLNLSDMYGKILAKKTVELSNGSSQVTFENVSTLPSGMYILSALHNGVKVQNKLIKNN